MANTKPKAAADKIQPREPTPLSTAFRRLAKEEPLIEPVGSLQFEGFAEARVPDSGPQPPSRQPPRARPPAAREPASRTPAVRTGRRDPPSDLAPPPSGRKSWRGRVRDWLGEVSPAFEPLTEVEAMTAPTPRPARPAGEAMPSNAAHGRSVPPSMPRNRRLYRRVPLSAEVEIAGVPCTLIDVSIGGYAAAGVPPLEPDGPVRVTLRLTIDGIEVATRLDARTIYVGQGRCGGRFVEPSASQTAFLRYLVTWRGASVGAVGTTTLLDAITGGAARDLEGAGRFGPQPRNRWWPVRGRRKTRRPG